MPKTPSKYDVPAGRRPEEFLNDAELVEYHALQAADDPTPENIRAHARAKVAAALTEGSVAETLAAGEAELAKAEK